MNKEEWYAQLFEHLGNSKFRSSFHLKQKEIDYINEKGLDTIREHVRDFIAKREAPDLDRKGDGPIQWKNIISGVGSMQTHKP